MYIMIPTKILITAAIWLTAIIGFIIVKPVSTAPTNPSSPSTAPTSPSSPSTAPTSPSSPSTASTSPSSPSTAPTSPSSPSTAPTSPSSPSTAPTSPSSPSTAPTSPSSPSTAPTSPGSPSTAPTSPSSPSTAPTSPSSPSTAPTSPSSPSTVPSSPSSPSTVPSSPSSPSTVPSSPSSPSTAPSSPSSPSTVPSSPSSPSTVPSSPSSPSTVPSSPSSPSTVPSSPSSPSTVPSSPSSPSTVPSSPSSPSTAPSSPSSPSTALTNPSSPSTTPTVSSTMATSPTVKISETNILITDSEDSLFVELEGKPKENLHGVRLSVYNATSPLPVGDQASFSTLLNGTLDEQGRQVITKMNNQNLNWTAISVYESVLIVLGYNDNQQESLLYSSKGVIDVGIAEKYNTSYDLILDTNLWGVKSLALSRCSPARDTSGFVLTHETKGKPNICMLSSSHNLEMKLTHKRCTKVYLPPDYNLTIANRIISEVNSKSHCGFSRLMVKDLYGTIDCPDNENSELYVKFQVMYDLPKQGELVLSGYHSFISDEKGPLRLAEDIWMISNCTENCLPAVKPPDSGDDGRIRVTVAVVVSCIGVFLIVLVFVIIYMKNKRRGILQFRMTRLDDDEDDLIGDMDDFVGNQGPTFRNYS